VKRREIVALFVCATVVRTAEAHSGLPATAPFRAQATRCVVVDDQIRVAWNDSNQPTIFGPAGVEIYTSSVASRPLYTNELPFVPSTREHRVLEPDTTNAFVWKTATVTEGHYFLFSYVREPPEELSAVIVRYAPYIVTVQHGTQPVGPTVVITRPDIFAGSLGTALIHYSACDPSGTARVRIEAAPDPGDGDPGDADYRVIADDLPAVETATVAWDTRPIEMGRWVIRAVIADDCGHVFRSYARGFLEVRVPVDPFDAGNDDAIVAQEVDARTGGGAACTMNLHEKPDAEARPEQDAGMIDTGIIEMPPDEGCSCSTSGEKPATIGLMLLPLLLAMRKRRWLLLLLIPSMTALAQDPPPSDATRPPSGEVLTYYGIRKLEFDANVSDEEKAREWEAFLKRNTEQVAYAKAAITRWRDAGRVRAVESAEQLDQMAEAPAADKIEAWKKVQKQFPKSNDARTAEKRITFWRTTESKRLAQIAAEVEKSRATKVERINAWRTVLDFAVAGAEKNNAQKRIALLEAQLFKEAEDLDRIPRVDVETKLSAWRDVLAGMPNELQKRTAEQRIAFLQSKPR